MAKKQLKVPAKYVVKVTLRVDLSSDAKDKRAAERGAKAFIAPTISAWMQSAPVVLSVRYKKIRVKTAEEK